MYVENLLFVVSIADATLASPQLSVILPYNICILWFQSQTRRLLPRNGKRDIFHFVTHVLVSIADATLASPQRSAFSRYWLLPAMFQSQTRRLLPRNELNNLASHVHDQSFNRRRDACFPATYRNDGIGACFWQVSIADATLASPQRKAGGELAIDAGCFNRRRDACFPATLNIRIGETGNDKFQSQTRRLLPRNSMSLPPAELDWLVSIADATLASPQLTIGRFALVRKVCFNRRRDACFPATFPSLLSFSFFQHVSIADATLASPQRSPAGRAKGQHSCFNRRRDACFPATLLRFPLLPFTSLVSIADATLASSQRGRKSIWQPGCSLFQSQTRRLLPRNRHSHGLRPCTGVSFQSQTRRLLPRNVV